MKTNHFPTHTVQRMHEINAEQTYILATVLRYLPDCTNNGVSSPNSCKTLFVPAIGGNYTLKELLARGSGTVILEIIRPAFPGCPFRFKPLGESFQVMAGGNYITGDSRFTETYGAPVSLHDRYEN